MLLRVLITLLRVLTMLLRVLIMLLRVLIMLLRVLITLLRVLIMLLRVLTMLLRVLRTLLRELRMAAAWTALDGSDALDIVPGSREARRAQVGRAGGVPVASLGGGGLHRRRGRPRAVLRSWARSAALDRNGDTVVLASSDERARHRAEQSRLVLLTKALGFLGDVLGANCSNERLRGRRNESAAHELRVGDQDRVRKLQNARAKALVP